MVNGLALVSVFTFQVMMTAIWLTVNYIVKININLFLSSCSLVGILSPMPQNVQNSEVG